MHTEPASSAPRTELIERPLSLQGDKVFPITRTSALGNEAHTCLRHRGGFHTASDALEGSHRDYIESSSEDTSSPSDSGHFAHDTEPTKTKMVRAGYLPVHGANTNRYHHPNSLSATLSWALKNIKAILGLSLLTVVLLQAVLYIPYMMGEERMRHWGLDGVPAQSPPEWLRPGLGKPIATAPPPPPPPAHQPPAIPPHGLPGHPPGGPPPGHHFPPDGQGEPPMQPGESPYSAISDKLRIGSEAFPISYTHSYSYDPLQAYPDGDPHTGVIPPLQLNILNTEKPWQRPPKPSEAPIINATLWPHTPWSREVNGSKTAFADSFKAHTQPLSPDARLSPFDGWRPPLALLNLDNPPAEQLGTIQFAFEDPSRHSGKRGDDAREELIKDRQRLVKAAFRHAWEGYKQIAWGHDELKPVSERAQDNFNGWGASIVDALDTLLIMDLPDDYNLARQHVHDIDFRKIGGERSAYGGQDGRIPVFETAIRYLGGFLAAYDLSGDELMRDRAEELAQLMEPAFGTKTGVPVGRIRFGSGIAGSSSSSSVLAEAGSMLLEYTRLWQVTGNRAYFDRVQRTTDWLEHNITAQTKLGALLPATLFPETGGGAGWYSFGGMCDSYYEYLPKEHQLLGGRVPQYSRMYSEAIKSARKWLIRDVNTVPNTNLVAMGLSNRNAWEAKLEHLACFSGGMLGLGSKLIASRGEDYDLAQRVTETCWWTYNSSATGIGPEDTVFYRVTDTDRWNVVTQADGTKRRDGPNGYPISGVRRQTRDYRGRPETIESVLYMWRITGDPIWQERGWQMFCSWVTHSMTRVGFANIHDVTQVPAMLADSMESFVFAETFKYYYLLFSPPDLISLDEYVFTTEAHPLLVPRAGRWTQPGTGSKKFWDPASATAASAWADDVYRGGEGGKYGGLTNAQKHDLYDEHQRKIERQRKQDEMMRAKAKLNAIVERAKNAGGDGVNALVSRMKQLIGSTEEKEAQGAANLTERNFGEGGDASATELTREQFQQAIKKAVEQIRQQRAEQEGHDYTGGVSAADPAANDLAASVVVETDVGPVEVRFAEAPSALDTSPSSQEGVAAGIDDPPRDLASKLEALLNRFDTEVDDEPLFVDVDDGEGIEDDASYTCSGDVLANDAGIEMLVEEPLSWSSSSSSSSPPPPAEPTASYIDLEGIQAAGIGAIRSALFKLNEVATAAGMPAPYVEEETTNDDADGPRGLSPQLKAKLQALDEERRHMSDDDPAAAQHLGMGFGSRMYASGRGGMVGGGGGGRV